MTSVHTALDGRIFHKECRSLARAGFQVTIVGAVPQSRDLISDGVHIKSIHRESSRFARMTRTVWRVYREARKQQADIYHFHDPELIPAGLLLRATGRHVIYDIHEDVPKDILSKTYLPVWSRGTIAWLMERLESAVSRHFSGLVAVTPSIAGRFEAPGRRTVVVHNYPHHREIVSQAQGSAWEEREASVGYIGLVSVQRGIREIVQALDLLSKTTTVRLELAGNQYPEDLCSRELSLHQGWAHVRYHGLLDQPSAFRLLHRVRAGLVLFHPEPNHVEAMPQKIFEYMGAAIPVIASDFPLWRRVLGDTGCGILVDPSDPHAIARAIEFVLTHPKEAEEMGRRGQSAVLERYNWDIEAKKLVEFYAGLSATTCAA
ncbi:MAG TPA: glycosyltransferase family 4 protein [Candidatus Acidoferrum sp.]|nr:glycosyltransferase family 4 protein [Candidatus Acidoferrum sp.]